MKEKREYYEILGLDQTADEAAIKKAYRRLAKKFHPDMNGEDPGAEQRFKEITEAYAVLSDPKKKKLYDQYGMSAFEEGASYHQTDGGFYKRQKNGYHTYYYKEDNMEDLFGDFFGNFFHEGTDFYTEREKRGRDLYADVSVSFEEAVFGCEKRISIQDAASFEGNLQTLQVHIPAGIDSGKSVRLRGKGMAGIGGGQPGDLLLRIHVKKKPGYERRGLDVYATVQIPYSIAVLGGEAVIPTLYGNVICRISKGTQPGTKIRLKNKGIVDMNHPSVYGDHYAVVQIEVPRDLTPLAEQKLREFAREYKNQQNGKHAA